MTEPAMGPAQPREGGRATPGTPARGRRPRPATPSEELRTLYDALPCAVIVTDSRGRLTYMNSAAEEMIGVPFATMSAAPGPTGLLSLVRLVHMDGSPLPYEEWPLATALETRRPVQSFSFGVLLPNGGCRWLQSDTVPVLGAGGRLRRVVASFVDVTALRQAEVELRQLASLVEDSDDAIIGCDLNGTIVGWNAGAARLYGYTAAEAFGRPLAILLPPAEGENLALLLRQIARGVPVPNYDAEVVAKDGSTVHVALTVSPLRDATGRCIGASCVGRDISARLRAEAALQASEERYREIFEHAKDMVYTHDLHGNFLTVNDACLEVTGYTREEALRISVWDLLAPESVQAVVDMNRRRAEGELTNAYEVVIMGKNGRRVTVEVHGRLIRENGRPVAVQSIGRDVSARKAAEEALRYQALHDALTGLPNRTLLYDRLQHGIAAAARDGEPVALLFMDLNRFKEVNDALGHLAGDALLQQVALRLRAASREVDTVARLGGDEFAVLLTGTGMDGAVIAAQKLLATLAAPFAIDQCTLSVGSSIGIAIFPEHGRDVEALMRCADTAMYVAKRAGGGVSIYDAESEVPHAGSAVPG